MKINWVDHFTIKTKFVRNEFIIEANKEGLLSLSGILKRMAEDDIGHGYVLHLDESNSLEDDSVGLVICKLMQ
jgi:hypothetical protein